MDWIAWLHNQPFFGDWEGDLAFTSHGAVFRFSAEGEDFALRPCTGRPRLAHNSRLASEQGWGPEWVAGDEDGFVVRWWGDGTHPHSRAEKRAVELLLENVHGSGVPLSGTDCAKEALIAGRTRWEKTGHPLPDWAVAEWSSWIETAVELAATGRSVSLHGDPHPGNILVLGERAMLLDWEYSGLGDPDWDLGYWSALSGSPPLNRRAQRYSVLARAAWRLWFGDEDKVSLMNKPLF